MVSVIFAVVWVRGWSWYGLGVESGGMVLVTLTVRSHSTAQDAAPPSGLFCFDSCKTWLTAFALLNCSYKCFCSAVSIGCIKLASQPFPISPLSEAGWLHCRDRPGLCSTKVPVPAKPPTDARTERTGHSQQSADTSKGIPDTGLRTILSRMHYFL